LEDERPEARLSARFADLVDFAVRNIEKTGWDRVVLVGHSGAGLIAGAVVPRCPRVQHLVFVAANIPAHGHGALSAFPTEVQERQLRALGGQALVPSIPMKEMEALVRQRLANRCSEDDVAFILRQEFRPEPPCVVTETMDWSGFPAIGRTYVVCDHDQTLTVEQQRVQASHLGIDDLRLVAGDHLPMVSCPGPLAQILNSVLARPA